MANGRHHQPYLALLPLDHGNGQQRIPSIIAYSTNDGRCGGGPIRESDTGLQLP
jgi:hypothetical protein